MSEMTGCEERRILERRATELANNNSLCLDTAAGIEVVVFTNGNDVYGIDSSFVFEVEKISNSTPLPDSLSGYSGVSNFRGILLPLIDLRKLFGEARRDNHELSHMLVVGRRQIEAGLVADSVESIRSISETLATGTNFIRENRQDYIRGIATGGMVVLAGDALLNAASRTD